MRAVRSSSVSATPWPSCQKLTEVAYARIRPSRTGDRRGGHGHRQGVPEIAAAREPVDVGAQALAGLEIGLLERPDLVAGGGLAGGPSLFSLMAIAAHRRRPFEKVTFTDIALQNLLEVEHWL